MGNLNKHLKLVFLLLLFLVSGSLYAQQTTIHGTVIDGKTRDPLPGATVAIKGTARGTVTDIDGGYTLSASSNETVVISMIGYTTRTLQASQFAANSHILLDEDVRSIDELVVVGYGVQKKATLTGAVSAVKGAEIVTTKNENVANMLTGKIAGLRIVQSSSEPGQFNSSIDLRGFGQPLVVIDGVVRDNIKRLDAEDVESISVLKDASAGVYGLLGGKGVILVTTKKGVKGTSNISYSGSMTWQRPSNFPEMVNAVDWMTLYNEKDMHNTGLTSPTVKYSDDEIASWGKGGTNTSTNWRKEVFRDVAPQTEHTLNASGGNDVVTYYASIGYQNQQSFLQTNAINYEKFSLRSNTSAHITKNLLFDLNISGFIDERGQTPHGSWDLVRASWIMRPMDQVWYDREKGMYMEPDNNTIINPVAAMNSDVSGRNTYKSKWLQSSASLTWDLPWVKGLSMKAFYSYDFILNDNKEYQTSYTLYDPGYATNNQSSTWLVNNDKPYQVARWYYAKNHTMWNTTINYKNTFADKHNVSAMALFESTYKEGDNFRGKRQVMLPVAEVFAGDPDNQTFEQDSGIGALYEFSYNSLVGRLTYDYAGKYMIEGTVRHEASSKFYKDMKWVTFPSVLVGYRISEEKFWKNSPLSFITNLKIRGSYGVIGDDGQMLYQWMTGYTYPSGGNIFYDDAGSMKYITGSVDKGFPNHNLTWTENIFTNIGLDLDAWNGLLGFSIDFFQRKVEGEQATRLGLMPGVAGISLPSENLNSRRNRGFDIEVSHYNRIGDFYYGIKGNFSYTKESRIKVVEEPRGNSYLNWRNNANDRATGIWWGYSDAGRITSWDEIYYNPVFISNNTILGDYEYKDWNGDGWISALDEHPLVNNSTTPLINYGLTLSGSWKGIDMSMLWQGTSSRYTSYIEMLLTPLTWGNAGTLSQFMDRWHPADPKANPYDPATKWVEGYYGYTGSQPNVNSMFNMQNASYVRLKSLEIGYTFPSKWMKTIGSKGIRVYANAYNLLTFTKLKYLDPESPSANTGYNYPLNKTFSVGLNVKF